MQSDLHVVNCVTRNDLSGLLTALKSHTANPNAKSQDGVSALQWAVIDGRLEAVNLLIAHKANVNNTDTDGWSALHFAAAYNQPKLLSLLLKSKADVNATANDGSTALHVGAGTSNTTFVLSLLRSANIGLDIQNTRGQTAVHCAGNNGCATTIKALVNAKASVDIIDKDGNTALHLACKQGHSAAAATLLELNAQRHLTNSSGLSACELAIKHGHQAIAALFLATPTSSEIRSQYSFSDRYSTCETREERSTIGDVQSSIEDFDDMVSVSEHVPQRGPSFADIAASPPTAASKQQRRAVHRDSTTQTDVDDSIEQLAALRELIVEERNMRIAAEISAREPRRRLENEQRNRQHLAHEMDLLKSKMLQLESENEALKTENASLHQMLMASKSQSKSSSFFGLAKSCVAQQPSD